MFLEIVRLMSILVGLSFLCHQSLVGKVLVKEVPTRLCVEWCIDNTAPRDGLGKELNYCLTFTIWSKVCSCSSRRPLYEPYYDVFFISLARLGAQVQLK